MWLLALTALVICHDVATTSGIKRAPILPACFALAAMLLVPTTSGYFWFFLAAKYGKIVLGQLLVNVAVAAIVGFLLVNIPWARLRVVRKRGWMALGLSLLCAVFGWFITANWTILNSARYVVEPADLKKIVLFDIHGATASDTRFGSVEGRITNGLSRAIREIRLKASFYNRSDELIEVKTLLISEPLQPHAPVSFGKYLGVDNLPWGWKFQLEVTEARYAP